MTTTHHTPYSTGGPLTAAAMTAPLGQLDAAIEAALGGGPFGTGDAQSVYNATTAQRLTVKDGTAATPDTSANPLVKVERTVAVADGDLTGDGCEQLASLVGISVGTTALAAQPVGLFGGAKHSGTTNGSGGRQPDACGIYGVGRITGSGTGSGIGGFFAGRRDNDTGRACGIEVNVANYGTVAGSYLATGASALKGIWLNAAGNADVGVGMQIQNAFGRQFKVGIGFGSQVLGGFTGGVADSSVRDDSTSTISLDIRGTHTYGLDLRNSTTTHPIRLPNNKFLVGRNSADTADIQLIAVSTASEVLLGSATGVIRIPESANIVFGTTTGTKLGAATTQKLSFWNATPVVQPTGIVDADGTLADITTKFNSLLGKLETVGLLAVA